MRVETIKGKTLNEVRQYYLRNHESLGFDSVDIIENTTRYNIDLLCKFFEMIPIDGDSNEGWINIQGPYFVTSSDIQTENKIVKGIPLFDVNQNEQIILRLNYTKGTPKDHAKFRQAYKFEQTDDGIKVYFNV